MIIRAYLQFEPRDLWIGIYWNLERGEVQLSYRCLHAYICILPMLPIHITFEWWNK